MISLEKWQILTPLQKLPKNEGDLGKLIVAKGFEWCPKCNKSPNLVTLEPKFVWTEDGYRQINKKFFGSHLKG